MELRGLDGGKSCREREKVMGGIKERGEMHGCIGNKMTSFLMALRHVVFV